MEFEGDSTKIREDFSLFGMEMSSISSVEILNDSVPGAFFEGASSNGSKASFHFKDSKCDAKKYTSGLSEKEDDESISSTSSEGSYARMPSSPLQTVCSIVCPIIDTSPDSDRALFLLPTTECTSRDSKPLFLPPVYDLSNESTGETSPCHSKTDHLSFMSLRLTYLVVTLVIMLADGLQGAYFIAICWMI
jgi:hypothetical protein